MTKTEKINFTFFNKIFEILKQAVVKYYLKKSVFGVVIKKESMGEEMETVGTWTIPYYGTTKTFQVDELTLPDTSYGVSKKG